MSLDGSGVPTTVCMVSIKDETSRIQLCPMTPGVSYRIHPWYLSTTDRSCSSVRVPSAASPCGTARVPSCSRAATPIKKWARIMRIEEPFYNRFFENNIAPFIRCQYLSYMEDTRISGSISSIHCSCRSLYAPSARRESAHRIASAWAFRSAAVTVHCAMLLIPRHDLHPRTLPVYSPMFGRRIVSQLLIAFYFVRLLW